MTSETASPTLQRLGDYELLEVIGRGGMGIVHKARQVSLDRLVALKLLPTFASLDSTTVARFRREAEATSRLQHPGIVPVYGCGEHEGTHYFAMGLVEGPSLAEVVSDLSVRRPSRLKDSLADVTDHAGFWTRLEKIPGGGQGNDYVRSCASLIADVANALAVAHMAQIIHRDLKPSNILIDPTGRPVLVDFGLARDEMSTGLTLTQEAIGTPSYMAPEQAQGNEVDARIDIYSLGATLYELLTLRPPFDGATPADIMRQIADVEPVPVRRINPQVPVELETVVHKCLAKDPNQRYPAIEALEVDLRSCLRGFPIMAVRPGFVRRVGTMMRRLRRGALIAASTVAIVGVAATIWGVAALNESLDQGAAALQVARDALVDKQNLPRALEFYGRAQILVGDPGQVSQARQSHLREAFARHYPHRLDYLQEILAAVEPAERDQLADLVDRLEGLGRYRLSRMASADLRTTEVELRALRDGKLEDEWRPLPPGHTIATGEYLVRVNRPGHHTRIHAIRVERDRRVDIDARVLPNGVVPPGMVHIADEQRDEWFAVAATELTRREYGRFLDGLSDSALRAEMEPLGWRDRRDADPDLPVRGLSYAQARAAAAHLGGHLPSLREFHLAASGGLATLRYPWGSEFQPGAIVADAARSQGPVPVTSGGQDVSPIGVRHTLGNVGEILSAGPDGRFLFAGGHYHTEAPVALCLDDIDSVVTPLRSGWTQSRYAGVRLARFLSQPRDMEQTRVAARVRGDLDQEQGSVAHELRVRADGKADYALTLTGFRRQDAQGHGLRFVTKGFLQGTKSRVLDGHGREIRAEFQASADRESSHVVIHDAKPATGRNRIRWRLESELIPTMGIRLVGDRHEIRFPLKASPGLATLHRIELPVGSNIELVEPKPDLRWRESDHWNVAWVLSGGQLRHLRLARVVFRKDGMLTTEWPARGPVVSFVRSFFAALSSGDREALRTRLHPGYLELPSGLDYTARISDEHPTTPTANAIRIQDVTAVSDVVTVDLTADWEVAGRDEEPETLKDWPLRLQLLREGESLRVIRLQPRNRADTGGFDANGAYVHARLQASINASGRFVMSPLQTELTEMQVLCVHPEDPSVRVIVLGLYVGDDDSEARARALVAPRPRRRLGLDGGGLRAVGPLSARVEGRSGGGLFGSEGQWARERWTYVDRGRRRFLVREEAHGATREDAEERFARSREWFDAVSASVVIR